MNFSVTGYGLLIALWLLPASVRADVVVIVGLENPITSLTTEQVARIFLRKKSDLPAGVVLEPVDQPKGSLRDSFYLQYIGMTRARINAYWAQRVFTGASQPPLQPTAEQPPLSLIAQSNRRIGYADNTQLTTEVRVVKITP